MKKTDFYGLFRSEYPNLGAHLSNRTLDKLLPFWIIEPNKMHQNVCMCFKCSNLEAAGSMLSNIGKMYEIDELIHIGQY